ncbi:MAG: outer membrane protein assembly factor BamA [Treponema sp.]|nr:outer membrane protein assembly factor BamA [Treponema sp.]
MRRRFLSLFLIVFCTFGAFSQEEDSDWFWGHPISKIEFEGLKIIKKSEITGVTSSFIGQDFTEEVYSEMLDKLNELDFFEDIEPYANHDKDPDKILLVFKVTEYPSVSKIEFTGNQKIRNGELRELIKSKPNEIYNENRVLIDERLIREHYIEKGYADSYVSHTTETTKDGVIITFKITEGRNTVISDIHMSGNTIVSERVLKGKISLKEVGFLKDGAFKSSSLEQDKKTIISYYNERGYIDANILDVKIESNDNDEKQRTDLSITFIIQEGAQYTYGGLEITGNQIFSTERLSSQMKLKEGSVFNSIKFEEGLSAITNIYYESGYMSNGFYPVPSKDIDRKEISYTLVIDERARSHVENVLVKGNNKTKDYVITREIPIESGDVFSRDKVISGLRNLYNLQYFSNVLPDVQQGSEENLVDLVFSVEETSTIAMNLGMAFSGISDPNDIPVSLYFTISNTNLFGEGKSISASVNAAKKSQTIDFSYSQGWIGNLPITFSESLSFSHTNGYTPVMMYQPNGIFDQYHYYVNYEGYSATLGSALGRRWTPRFAILSLAGGLNNTLTRYQFDENTFVPVDSGISMFANRVGLMNSFWTSFSMDDRDINYDPSKGWFASQKFTFYGLIPKVEKEFFLSSETKLEGYVTLFDWALNEKNSIKGILAVYTGLTMLFPINNSVISDSNKPYIDGMFTGRGWAELYRSADTKGKVLWNTQIEFRIPVVPGVVGVDFFNDAVVVKPEVNQLFNNLSINDFYFSMGPGIRFLMQQFPLHLLFTWRYQVQDGKIVWGGKNGYNPYMFVLSFNIVNR